MKKLPALTLSLALVLTAAAPAIADDFGARFSGEGAVALQDAPSDDIAGELQNIAPAAGDPAADVDPEAQADVEAEADITAPPAAIEAKAGMETSLSGPSEPEPTPQEKTESSIINHDQGMSPDAAEDPSYRLQDSTN